jgi:hypothetical protein
MTIESAADEVRRRSLEDVIALWGTHDIQSLWKNASLGSDIRERLQTTAGVFDIGRGSIFRDQDLKQIALTELLLVCAKAAHFTRALQRTHAAGHYTVSAFNAFHGTLFLARAILGIFGVFLMTCNVGGKSFNCLVDLFPWLGTVDYKKQFRKKHGQGLDLFGVHPVKRKIESQDIWKVFSRVMRVGSLPALTEAEKLKLHSFDYALLSRQRNQFVYHGPAWTWPSDRVEQISRSFDASVNSLGFVDLLELAETEDFPEFILDAALFYILETCLTRVFSSDFDQANSGTALLPLLLFGAESRDAVYSQAPLVFLKSRQTTS